MKEIAKEVEGFDQVFELVGGRNRYQLVLLGIVSLQACVLSFHHVGYVFLGAIPDHWCEIEELRNTNWTLEQIKNISIPSELDAIGTKFEKCKYYDLDYENLASKQASYAETYASIYFGNAKTKTCTKWTYDKSIYESTTVTQFDLVCERNYLVATIQATYMAGAFVGSFTMGGLSDGFLGRRRATLVAVVLVLICGFGAGLSTSYINFIIFRFFIAIGVVGSLQNGFTILMEYMDSSYRAFIGTMMWTGFAVGCMIMPLYAYFIRDWSNLQFAFTGSCLILLIYFWILPESSRWLISKGREDEALKILKGIAKTNKKPEPNEDVILKIFAACKAQSYQNRRTGNAVDELSVPFYKRIATGLKEFIGKYLQLVGTQNLGRRSFVLWILFASTSLIYYGVMFGSVNLTNDPFLLVFLGGFMEIPGLVCIAPFVEKWGRRPTIVTIFFLTGTALIGVSLTPFGCYAVVYVLGNELYPTETRASGLAFASLMSRFSSMHAPFVVNQMNNVYADLPNLIFGVTDIFAGIVAFLLPETKDVGMLEYVHAIEVSDLDGMKITDHKSIPEVFENHEKILTGIDEPDVKNSVVV